MPLGSVLKNRWLVGGALRQSKTAAVYIGKDIESGEIIEIREFFPKALSERALDAVTVAVQAENRVEFFNCLGRFERYFKAALSAGEDAPLETVLDLFYSNETVYAVSRRFDCVSLFDYFKNGGGLMSWTGALSAFSGILSALEKMHSQGIVHARISPETVRVCKNGRLRLFAPDDFSKNESDEGLLDGYALVECFSENMPVLPCADVYSLMAVIYFCMTGLEPQPSKERAETDSMLIPHSLAENMPDYAIDTLIRCMKIQPEDRVRNISVLRRILTAGASEKKKKDPTPPKAAEPAPDTAPKEAAARPKKEPPLPQSGEKEAPPAEESEGSVSGIIFKSSLSAVLVCAIIFCTMYSTFLFKRIDVPLLDKIFAPLTFLPMNYPWESESEENTTTAEPETTPEPTRPVSPTETVEVADFKTLTYTDIRSNAVFNKNFDLDYVFEYSDKYEKYEVISQSLPAGQRVGKGTKIVLIISSGPEMILLRDVVGMDYAEAEKLLSEDGFTVKKTVRENDGGETPGKVYMMSLVAGLEFDKGTEITLTVWGDIPI